MSDDADEFIDRLTDPMPKDVSAHIQAMWLNGEDLTAIEKYLRTVYGEDSDIIVEHDDRGGFGLVVEFD